MYFGKRMVEEGAADDELHFRQQRFENLARAIAHIGIGLIPCLKGLTKESTVVPALTQFFALRAVFATHEKKLQDSEYSKHPATI